MKRTTLKTRLWALAATLLLLVSLLAMPVSAANAPVAGGTFDFDKYLVMDINANVPNVSFTFSIAPGKAVSASGTNHVIYKGNDVNRVVGTPVLKVGGVSTGTVTFAPTPTENTYTSAQEGDVVTLTGEQKYAVKTLTVDFSGVTFKAPGIYRYVITEQKANPKPSGISYDTNFERTLDVTVQYKAGSDTELEVSGYTFYKTNKTDGSDDTGTKDTGFTNTYAAKDLTLTKIVSGNQGDRDKFFKFTVTISNAVPGTVYDVTIPTTGAPTQNDLEQGDSIDDVNLNKLTVGSAQAPETTGSVTAIYYLKHNQSIVIKGLTADTQYTITEADYSGDGYSTTNTDNTEDDADGKTTKTKEMGTAPHTVTFTNSKSGTVPTGILLETAPYLILGAVVVAGLVVLFATRRRRTRE